MTTSPVPTTSRTAVLQEIRVILAEVLNTTPDLEELEIEPETALIDDLGLESIDLVTIGAMLTERYGERVNLASFLAAQDIEQVIAMTVGSLVDFVAGAAGGDHDPEG